jgi:hypothetical protein
MTTIGLSKVVRAQALREVMMAGARVKGGLKTTVRVGVLVAGLFAVAFIARAVLGQVPKLLMLKAALAFLIALEASYGVALALALVGVSVLAPLVIRGRARGLRRPLAARGLLLCTSLLVGLVLCEATAAALRSRSRRTTAVPAGGFGRTEREKGSAPLPDLTEEIALPTVFPDPPGDTEVDVVVVGESSAAGVPYNFWLSIGKVIVWKLEEAIPGRQFHLNVLADSGETLERQHRKLAQLTHRPDLLIIYCGHNEFTARLPPSRDLNYYLDAGEPTPWDRFVDRVERVSPFCGLIRTAADKCRVAIPPPPNGNRVLVDTPVYSPAEYDALLADFRRRLEAIVSYAGRVGALPVLIVPPSNELGFEPSRSFLPRETTRADREAFARAFSAARRIEASDPSESIRRYRSLLDRQPRFAEAHFRLARLLAQAGQFDEAYRHGVAARDCDGVPMRCLTSFQDVYRELASRHPCVLIDGQAYFHAIGRHGLLDDRLFHDGMHPSLRGLIALAQAVLVELQARRVFGWPSGSPAPVVDPVQCAKRFGLNAKAWNKLCHWGIMFYDLASPARYDPSERRAKQDAFGKSADRIAAGERPEAVGLPNIGIPEAVPPLPASGQPVRESGSSGDAQTAVRARST